MLGTERRADSNAVGETRPMLRAIPTLSADGVSDSTNVTRSRKHTSTMPTPSRRALRRVLVALAAAGACTIGMATRAPAQSTAVPAEGWSWAELRATPGVDTTQVAWLEANVPRPEAIELFTMLGALSRPEVVQHDGPR